MTLDKKVNLNEMVDVVGGRIRLDENPSCTNWFEYGEDINIHLQKGRSLVVFYAERQLDGTYRAELLIPKEDFNKPYGT